jgi:rfaE bifunctional protein kinase chain/domain
MDPSRFQKIIERFPALRIAIVGDFCLDRYLEIDPARKETSIETALPVHNVVNVRSQPGGAGTILNNVSALGARHIYPIGFSGHDGEGTELRSALQHRPGVQMGYFVSTSARRTFTYCKPLVIEPGKPPVELNRLDFKNWTSTPAGVEGELIDRIQTVIPYIDAMIILDQVDIAETGVVTRKVLEAIQEIALAHPGLLIIADSRRSLRDFPPVCFKMNRAELAALANVDRPLSLDEARQRAATLASTNGRPVFVTLSEEGILGASAKGEVHHAPTLPVRGPIDVVGAGDAVTANLCTALAAGATIQEALEIAMAAASVVVHQLGTTGTASVPQIRECLIAR